jgi:membrane protein required for colicin V production
LNWIDAVLGLIILLGFIHGVLKGAIAEIFAVLALVVGVIVAGRVSSGTTYVTSQLSHPTAGRVFVFIITFVVVAIVIGLIGKMFSGLAKAANLRMIDRFIGGIVGACLIALAAGVFLKICERLGMDMSGFNKSFLARSLIQTVSYLAGFLPEVTQRIEKPPNPYL